ncbi:hypothetical protein L345_06605, partial [Ophiophagus hannah]
MVGPEEPPPAPPAPGKPPGIPPGMPPGIPPAPWYSLDLLLVLWRQLVLQLLVFRRALHVEGQRLQGVLCSYLLPLDLVLRFVLLCFLDHAFDLLFAKTAWGRKGKEELSGDKKPDQARCLRPFSKAATTFWLVLKPDWGPWTSTSPLSLVMVILFSLPVLLSTADTLRIPLASMSKVTSIWGTPRGAGGMPVNSNLPSKLLSLVMARSPSYTCGHKRAG